MIFPRLLVNDNVISSEQMHSFDASKGYYEIKVRFLYKTQIETQAPLFNQDLDINQIYDIKLLVNNDIKEIGKYKLYLIKEINDGFLKFKKYYFKSIL